MHGVRREKFTTSTEEQKEAKRKEREKKLQAFLKGSTLVLTKNKNVETGWSFVGVFDEEGLGVSGKLLFGNPDVYTFWNYRRRVLGTGTQTLEDLYQQELSLTEIALEKNPKSYSAWHQRGWVLQRMGKPDYQKELKLCNLALQMDERNFHCWDHRRLVCGLAEISPQAELDFTSEKVRENFSNYSAWHYRSSLLPSLKPPTVPGLPLATEALIEGIFHKLPNANASDLDNSLRS